jgi:hypothetical protein
MYDPATTPQGVPSPFMPAVHPYPSYEHGPDYTRPVFDMPFVQRPYNVMNGVGQFDFLTATVEEHREKQRMAFWKGVGAASVLGVLLAASGVSGAKRGPAIAQAAVSFGVVGLVAAGVTYATWPKVGD